MKSISRACLASLFLCLAACTTTDVKTYRTTADAIALTAGFSKEDIATDHFLLRSYYKEANLDDSLNGSLSDTLTVYIEGDGKAWLTRYKVSSNPTPSNPIALRLAAADQSSDNILYLARPCQYVDISPSDCPPRYWTSARYSSDVSSSVNSAINKHQQHYGYKHIQLVGFSGGATVALLVAAQRNDVTNIMTIAGNLDTDAFTELHKVTPLTESVNPTSKAKDLADIPQIHFFGKEDKLVPMSIGESYLKTLPTQRCAKLKVLPENDHHNGWVENWQKLLADTPSCDN